jgi:hypothetical protein
MRQTLCSLGLPIAVWLTLAGCGSSIDSGPGTADLAGGGVDGGAGSCSCLGQGLSTDNVSCNQDMGNACQFTCRGENYDVDGKPQNGCEQLHPVPPGHTMADAADRGSHDCFDTNTDTVMGFLMSDSRAHINPTVVAFNAQVGSAPDWYRVEASGGTFCQDNYNVTFSTAGGNSVTQCYRCTIMTDKMVQSVTVTGNDMMQMSSGSGSYSDGSVVYFKVEKICSLPIQEAVRYQILFNL